MTEQESESPVPVAAAACGTDEGQGLPWGFCLLFLGTFLLVCLATGDFRALATSPHDLGPRALPGFLGAILLLGGVVELIARRRACQCVFQRAANFARGLRSDPGLADALGLLGSLIAFLVAWPWLGFSVCSLLLTTITMRRLGQRWITAVSVAVVLVAVTKLLFGRVFAVPLPEGWLENWGL